MNLILTTSYEQKFIGDIDPGAAMLDIIQNLIYLGTRDTKFMFKGESKIMSDIKIAAKSQKAGAWWSVIKTIVDAFFNAIKKLMIELGSIFAIWDSEDDIAAVAGEPATDRPPAAASAR